MNSFFKKILFLVLFPTLANSSNNKTPIKKFQLSAFQNPSITYSSPFLKEFNNVKTKYFKKFFSFFKATCLDTFSQGYKLTLDPVYFKVLIEKIPATSIQPPKKDFYQAHFAFFDLCVYLARFFSPKAGFEHTYTGGQANENIITLSLYSNNNVLLKRNASEEVAFKTYETSSPSDSEFPDMFYDDNTINILTTLFIQDTQNKDPRPFILRIELHENPYKVIILRRIRIEKLFPFKKYGKSFFENAAIFYTSGFLTSLKDNPKSFFQKPGLRISGYRFSSVNSETVAVSPTYEVNKDADIQHFLGKNKNDKNDDIEMPDKIN